MMRQKMRAALWMGVILGAPALSLAGPVPPAITITPNYDLVVTQNASLDMGPLGNQKFLGVPLKTFDFGPPLGIQNVGVTDTIIRRNSGGTLNNLSDSFQTSIDVVAICLKSENILDLGFGADYYYATLGSGPTSGLMTINGDGTWTNNFSFDVDLHRGSKSGPVDMAAIPFSLSGQGAWDRVPGPYYNDISSAVTNDPQGDGEFFLLSAFHKAPGKIHDVIDITHVPEPSTGLLLLAGGVAVVWRKRKTRLAV